MTLESRETESQVSLQLKQSHNRHYSYRNSYKGRAKHLNEIYLEREKPRLVLKFVTVQLHPSSSNTSDQQLLLGVGSWVRLWSGSVLLAFWLVIPWLGDGCLVLWRPFNSFKDGKCRCRVLHFCFCRRNHGPGLSLHWCVPRCARLLGIWDGEKICFWWDHPLSRLNLCWQVLLVLWHILPNAILVYQFHSSIKLSSHSSHFEPRRVTCECTASRNCRHQLYKTLKNR